MRSSGFEVFAALPPDVRKRSALPFRLRMIRGSGSVPPASAGGIESGVIFDPSAHADDTDLLGIAQNKKNGLAGRPEAFRTSAGRAGDFLGKADASRLEGFDVGGVLQSEADIVQSFEQAIALKVADLKSSEEPVRIGDGSLFKINC